MDIDKDIVQTKFLEFKKIHAYTNCLDEYVKYLIELGYTDRAVLLHISPMLHNMITRSREN